MFLVPQPLLAYRQWWVHATTSFITIPTGTVEYIEKKPNDVVYGSGTARVAKVGYTG